MRAQRGRPTRIGRALAVWRGPPRRPASGGIYRDEGGAFPRKAPSPADTGFDDRRRNWACPRHPPDPRPHGPDGVRRRGARGRDGRADALAAFASESPLDPMPIMPPLSRDRARAGGASEFEAE